MKEIIIKGKSIRRELWILLGCFVFAICVNIFAIIKYSRPAKELVTMIGYVFVVAIITYITLWAIRLLVILIVWIIRKISNRS